MNLSHLPLPPQLCAFAHSPPPTLSIFTSHLGHPAAFRLTLVHSLGLAGFGSSNLLGKALFDPIQISLTPFAVFTALPFTAPITLFCFLYSTYHSI